MKELPKCTYNYNSEQDPYEKRLRQISYSTSANSRSQKILLVVAPSPQKPTPGREFLVTGPFEGFTYVATLVKKMGFVLEVVDCRLKKNPIDLVLRAAVGFDAIGVTAFCDSFVFLEELSKKLKERYPDTFLFFGGPLVTALPKVVLGHTQADCALIGESELTIIELLERYFGEQVNFLEKIKGVAYRRENGDIIINQQRSQIKDLDNLPLLDYTVWPQYESIIRNGQILISSMRGCPQECSFCFKTIPALRLKSLVRFEEEVAYLKKTTSFNYTWLNDLTFNIDDKRCMNICKILKKHEIKYHVFARVQNVTTVLCETLAETGCLGIWFGIESYDNDVLALNRKHVTKSQINSAVNSALAAGLLVRGLFIVGLYGETKKSLQTTYDYIKENNFIPLVKYLVPFPGTSIYNYAVDTKRIPDVVKFLRMLSYRQIRDYDDEIINCTELSDDVLREYFHKIWNITNERDS